MEITFAAPTAPWSLNQERTKHWSWRARRVRAWRAVALDAARLLPHPRELGPSSVSVVLPFERNARRDPSNFLPPVKALIDGLVEAGLWPDDNAAWVTIEEPTLAISPDNQVTVRIRPRD
jgi:crossover junction endodeoxyribonuclease RusA